jgi:Cu(I)/Ag(I) efflux system protein CusF
VKAVDPAKGTVTFAHGPVASLHWPAMTMSFTVADKSLLGKLSPNQTVDFEFKQQGKDYVVTAVK